MKRDQNSTDKFTQPLRRAEEALQTGRDLVEIVTKNIGAGLAIISRDYRIIWANQVLKKIFGGVEGEICHATYHNRPAICPGCGVREVFETGKDKAVHHQAGKDKEGNTIWTELVATPIRDKEGNIIAALEVVLPITERKRLERKQSLSEQRLEALWEIARMGDSDYRTLCDHVQAGILTLTQSRYGFYGFLNEDETVLRLYSWSRETMEDCRLEDKPTEFSIVKAGLWADAVRARRTLIINNYQADHPSKKGIPDGHVPLTRVLAVPIFSHGRIVALGAVANKATEYTEEDAAQMEAFLGNAQIILEKRQAEETRRVLEGRYQELVEGVNAIVWEADPQNFQFTFVSQRAEAITGYPVDQWLSEPNFWANHIHLEDRDRSVSFCRKATLTGQDHDLEYRMIRADGSIVWLKDVVKVECAQGVPVRLTGIMIDITEQKLAQEERKRLEAQLLQAQKMEAVGNLAAGLAHDFNNLLQIFQGAAQFLLHRKKKGEPGYEELQMVLGAVDEGTALTRQLLTLSRRGESKREPLDLNQKVREIGKLLELTIPEMITIELHLAEDPKTISADPAQIEQVLLNLATNARDAMPEGGSFIIETANVTLDEEQCQRHLETTPGDYVVLTVSDTGHGMDDQTLARIFEPFFTTKERGKGTGLGLAMVYGVVKSHDGFIRCYSKPGEGTRFKIYLPAMNFFE